MTDPEPTPAEPEPETAPQRQRPANGLSAIVDVGSVGALQRSARHATLGLAAYTAFALGLIAWSLRRGRLSDALLLVVALAVTLPPIVSYRKQVRQRLQTLVGGDRPDAPSTAAGTEACESQGENASDPPTTDAPSSPSEA